MAKHKTRTVIACVGGTMFALGIGSLSLRITEWSETHHGVLTAATIVGFCGAAAAALVWLLTKDETVHTAPIVPEATVPEMNMRSNGDITRSPQFGTVNGPVYIGDHPVPALPILPPPQPNLRLPNIVSHGWKKKIVEEDIPAFGIEKGDALWVLEIQNRLEGISIDTARSVCASLEFRGLYNLLELVPTAWWFDHDNYEIEVPVNHVEKIVLGRPTSSGNWTAYGNRRQFGPTLQQLRSGYYDIEPDMKEVSLIGKLVVEVTVFSRHRGTLYMKQRWSLSLRDLDGEPEFEALPLNTTT